MLDSYRVSFASEVVDARSSQDRWKERSAGSSEADIAVDVSQKHQRVVGLMILYALAKVWRIKISPRLCGELLGMIWVHLSGFQQIA